MDDRTCKEKYLMRTKTFFSLLFCFCFAQNMSAQKSLGLYFHPDYRFQGSALTGWKQTGNVKWSAQNGEITAAATTEGGLLQLNQSFQDVVIQLLVKCAANEEAGVLFRLEKIPEGIKAVLISLKDSSVTAWNVLLDAQGKITKREKLRTAGGIIRIAPPPSNDNSPANRNPPNRPAVPGDVPLQRVATGFKTGEWNQLELYADANMVRAYLNDGGAGTGVIEEGSNGFGALALYASGNGTVQFREIIVKDLAIKTLPVEQSSSRFSVQRINDMYYSWGCTAGDYNKDGHMDVAAGPWIYFGPGFTRSREIFLAVTTSPGTNFTETNCQYTYDFNNDGWPDIVSGPNRANLYINPRGESRRWDKYVAIPVIQSEITVFKDIDKDGRPEMIYGADGIMRFARPDPTDATKPWTVYDISERGYAMAHGLGAGDINGDGRTDVINPNGWWEQPAAGATSGLWKYHPAALARYGHRATGAGGATMGVYDVNGDGLNDVVTSLNAHGFGLAWYEQKRDAAGIRFEPHMISDDYAAAATNAGGVTISQIHGTTFEDIDGDGISDLIAGKRYWSHLDTYLDPDPSGAPVIYYYRTVRDPKAPGGAKFVPELIHNRSGVGSDVLAIDLNKDKKPDIISATDRGVFIFWNKGK
jgi:hypothetical protein